MEILEELNELLGRLRSTSSSKDKIEILRSVVPGSWVYLLIRYALDDSNFYITSDNLRKNSDLVGVWSDGALELLSALSSRRLTGHEAIKACNGFLSGLSEGAKASFLCVLDKDLACGVNAKVANKAIHGWVPVFNVALAESIGDTKLDDSWVLSRKLDGCRLITFIDSADNIRFYSRQGKEIFTLDVLRNELSKFVASGLLDVGIVLDGELCIEKDGIEDFQSVIKEVRRKDWTITEPRYILFDYLSRGEFFGAKSGTYRERLAKLSTLPVSKYFRVVEHCDYTDENYKTWQERVVNEGWEGLIARKNVPYESKRSKNMLKIKSFNDAEYKVFDVDKNGEATIFIDGLAKQVPAIRCLLIKHKGNTVGVGSGLTPEQRVDFLAHPEKIIGKTICVKYFSESTDENGNLSLRFPVVKVIYENNRDC